MTGLQKYWLMFPMESWQKKEKNKKGIFSLSDATQNLEIERWGWLWRLPKRKSQKPDLGDRSKRKMRWLGDMRSVSWPGTCALALGTGEVPGSGNKVPDEENCWFKAVRPASGRQRDETVEPWREEGQKQEAVVSLIKLSIYLAV